LEYVGNTTAILLPIALGLLFSPGHLRFDKTLAIVGLRMGLGLIIGAVVCIVAGLEGIDRIAVLSLATAPIGFNMLTFASTEKLDTDLAANAVSLSLLAALILIPAIILWG
jgi:predicted permease